MKLIRRQLGDGIRIKHGFAFLGKFFSDQGRYIILTPGNFYEGGGFKSRPEKDRFYTGIFPHDYVLKKGDLIIAMTEQGPGLLGSSAFIPEDNTYLHNQRLGLVDEIDADVFEKRYLFHLFNSRTVRSQIYGSATGTKVKHTSPKRVYKVKVLAPDVDKQEEISSIIENYYQLIKINRRRIQLLEETARILYREWFVCFRFPGHEKVKIVDGVPEGWKKENIFSIADVNYGKNLPTNKFTEKGEYPVYGAAKIIGKFNKYTKEKRTIITGCRGSVGQVTITRPKSYITNNSFTFEPKNLEIFYWLYFSLGVRGFGDVISGTAQPQITLSSLSRIKLVSSNVEAIKDFELKAANYFNLIFTLEDQNQKLAQARDLLLPRLMSGAIEVSEFDIKIPQEAET